MSVDSLALSASSAAAPALAAPAESIPNPAAAPSTTAAVLGHHDSLYVAWARARQQEARRRQALMLGLQAQPDPSEAAGIAGPITAWAHGHARQKGSTPMPSPGSGAVECGRAIKKSPGWAGAGSVGAAHVQQRLEG
jgi:hypothetical protein